MDRWTHRIAAHRSGHAAASRTLLTDTLRATGRLGRRYPGVYFELCRRDDDSVTSFGHRVFVRLDGRRFGRFPFSDRTPFDAYLEDDFEDRDVRWHSFDARLSIAREVLREQYAFNVRRHPEWAAKDQLHKGVVATLKDGFPTWPGRSARYPRYGLEAWPAGPRTVRRDWDRDEVVRIVARRAAWPLRTRIELVLARHGAPMYPAAISSILQDADVASSDSSLDPDQLGRADDAVEQCMSVRRIVAERWEALETDEQRLLALLVAGRPYREIVELVPRFRDPSAVTRALGRICARFIADLADTLGGERTDPDGAPLKPKQQAELLFGVLVELPQVRAAMEAAG